jgi:hypothetical protein
MNKAVFAAFALILAATLFVGCRPRDDSAGREAGQTKGEELNADARGSYASVNGLNMYYEIHGTGRPLVLLHGALTAIDTSCRRFGALPNDYVMNTAVAQ